MKLFNGFDREDFRVAFRAVITFISLVYAGFYTWNVTFIKEGEEVSKHGEFILGFLLGTLVATLYNYYFGGNENGQAQTLVDSTGPPVGATFGSLSPAGEVDHRHDPDGKIVVDA